MSSDLQSYLSKVLPADGATAALVFETVYKTCQDICFLESFLSMAGKTGEEIEVTSLPSLIRQLSRMSKDLYGAYVLLCPSIDPGHAEELLKEDRLYGSKCRLHSICQEAK